MDAYNKCIGFDLIMLRLLNQLNYTPPNLKLYKKDTCEVTFDDYNQMYRLFIGGEDYMSYKINDHDEAYELYSHYDLAKGHCICTGLGFGVRENWLLTKKEVSKVTVLEKNKEVIDYHKYLNPKLFDDVEVIHINAYDYKGKCDTLLLDHYEDEAGNAKLEPKKIVNDMFVLQAASEISDNIECDRMWMWTLELIVAERSWQRSCEVGSYVSKTSIYNEIKTEFNLNKLPDLTEEELQLYYFMYNSWSSFSSRYFK